MDQRGAVVTVEERGAPAGDDADRCPRVQVLDPPDPVDADEPSDAAVQEGIGVDVELGAPTEGEAAGTVRVDDDTLVGEGDRELRAAGGGGCSKGICGA